MVSKAQLRILAWLNNYPDSLTKSWDVTREVSLPGIAEALGVVRSALNLPLRKLEKSNLITKRMAHVVGGGSRRRQVFHITANGRTLLENTEGDFIKSTKSRRIIGNSPLISEIFGRATERQHCLDLLQQESLLISGMPGIGKSAFAVSLCKELAKKNTIRWAVADQFTDNSALLKSWFPDEIIPHDIESVAIKLENSASVLIIDDVDLISQRHIGKVSELVENLASRTGVKCILVSRHSAKKFTGFANFKLAALDLASCCEMLGEEIIQSEREQIASSLGNHPLAIKLYQPEYEVPESSSDIVDYVENVVLNTLSTEQKRQVSTIALEPRSVPASKSIAADEIEFFDQQNLMLWSGEEFTELQYLVRNVIRENLDDDGRRALHKQLAEHWQDDNSASGLEHYLYHLSCSDVDGFVTELSAHIDTLEHINTAAIAAIVNNCILANGCDSDLALLESRIAAYRFEPDIIRANLEYLPPAQLVEMRFTLARIEGRVDEYDLMLDDILAQKTHTEQARLLILLANATLEDRLPGKPVTDSALAKVTEYLKRINLSRIDTERQSVIVAMSLIKHSIALGRKDLTTAEEIIQTLCSIGSVDDSIIINLRTKEAILRYCNGAISLSEVSGLVDANCALIDHQMIAESIKLRLTEVLLTANKELAESHFADLSIPDKFPRNNTSLRYAARWWLLHSEIYTASNMSSLREALRLYREAGCSNVAAELEARFHVRV